MAGCPDWEQRIIARQSLITAPLLFPDVAEEAWARCSKFKLVDVVGEPLLGEVSLPWLRDLVMTIFGAEDPDGRRHINEIFLIVSKKNAKSTIAAAIMLLALLMNWRKSGELLILSPTKEIADNSFKPIHDFIKSNKQLSKLLKVAPYHRLVTHNVSGLR